MPTTYNPIANSTFLEYAGSGIANPAQTVEQAYQMSDGGDFPNGSSYGINVALVLDRANDPTAMLAGDWGSRQTALQALGPNALWTTYGADVTQYNNSVDYIQNTLGLTVLNSSNSNYISSAASRTIWVEINTQAEWKALFGPDTPLKYSPTGGQQGEVWYWNGSLSLPSALSVAGLWLDQSTAPAATNMAPPGVSVTLPQGWQSIGNAADTPDTNPQDVGSLYNFPLVGANYQTGTIGLIEPGVGTSLTGDEGGSQFETRLTSYLTAVGTSGTGSVLVQGVNGQSGISGERSLDVGIVAAVNPNSNLALYNGSGDNVVNGNAQASVFTAIQSSIFGTASNLGNTQSTGAAPVTTDSWGDAQYMAPDSPFYYAYMQLYVDAALANQTTLIALGDGGSGFQTANGLATPINNQTSPYNVLVGGTSISTVDATAHDPTLNGTDPNFTPIYNLAMAGDEATLWRLMSGGLNHLPSTAASRDWLVETVWNEYETTDHQTFVGGNGSNGSSYQTNNTGSGGIDTTQATPGYQVDYGLTSAIYTSLGLTGRGTPDVVAPAGGNLFYTTPGADMTGLVGEGGTSAATPF